MERLLPWGIVATLMTAACFLRPRVTRGVVGIFFALMGLGVHGAFVLVLPESYVGFARQALIPAYAKLAESVVLMLTPVIFGCVMLVFEVVLAVLMLGKGRGVTVGLVVAALFLFAITPLGIEVLPNAVLAVGLLRLAREDYPLGAFAELRAWRAKRRGRGLTERGAA
jgi:hypothetical protein